MASRSSEAWFKEHWGQPCRPQRVTVRLNGHPFSVDDRAKEAWWAWEGIRAKHGYDLHPPYPEGDSGTYNCRHIGNDASRPWSTHAWAAALDANWQDNPDGPRLVTDVPQEMRDDLLALRTKTGAPVFRWGGDWDRDPRTGHSYYDAMHWEIAATPAELSRGLVYPKNHNTLEKEIIMSAVVELIDAAYRRVRGASYNAKVKDPKGWRHWMEQLLRRDPVEVLRECEALLAQEAGL